MHVLGQALVDLARWIAKWRSLLASHTTAKLTGVGSHCRALGAVGVFTCANARVIRARAMPQRQNIVATKGPTGPVNVFDTSKYTAAVPEAKPGTQLPSTPDMTLYGHDEEGYGLSWSHVDAGKLLSGSDDARVCMWDTVGNPSAVQTFSAHTGVVEVRLLGSASLVPQVGFAVISRVFLTDTTCRMSRGIVITRICSAPWVTIASS
jgi:hypothetical protein